MDKKSEVRVNINLTRELYEKLRKLAYEGKKSMSEVVRSLLEKNIK